MGPSCSLDNSSLGKPVFLVPCNLKPSPGSVWTSLLQGPGPKVLTVQMIQNHRHSDGGFLEWRNLQKSIRAIEKKHPAIISESANHRFDRGCQDAHQEPGALPCLIAVLAAWAASVSGPSPIRAPPRAWVSSGWIQWPEDAWAIH